MITIDSQIWIYFFDPNASENSVVTKWPMIKLVNIDDKGLNVSSGRF